MERALSRGIHIGRMAGTMEVPPSKSITHRLLVMAALSGRACRIRRPLFSEDTLVTWEGLRKLGFPVERDGDSFLFTGKPRTVSGSGDGPVKIDVGNSGTSARFLTALAGFLPGECVIDGNPRMRMRPMSPLIDALRSLGIEVLDDGGRLPLRIAGGTISGNTVEVDTSRSSQFLSALLLAAPLLPGGLRILHGGVEVSRPYSEMTIALMRRSGVGIRSEPGCIVVEGGAGYSVGDCMVEGDYSSASYFLIGAAITGGEMHVTNLARDSVQGDRVVLEILRDAGAVVSWRESGVLVASARLRGIDRDMGDCPDLDPAVAVLALFSSGASRLRNVMHLRFKESDRLEAIVGNIARMGGDARTDGRSLVVEPRLLHGAILPTFDDHRIAMSFALAGLVVPGVELDNPGCVKKSYPDFWRNFEAAVQREE